MSLAKPLLHKLCAYVQSQAHGITDRLAILCLVSKVSSAPLTGPEKSWGHFQDMPFPCYRNAQTLLL